MIAIVILGVCAILGIFAVVLWRRNDSVYDFRMALIDEIHHFNQADINASWKWRYTELDSVSRDEMVWKFWRPLKSFYREGFPEKEAS